MHSLNRRNFLKHNMTAEACLIGTSRLWSGANDRIRVGVIGMGGRGGELARQAGAIANVEVVAVCDPDVTRMAKFAAQIEGRTGKRPAEQPDLRRLIEDQKIDAVTIAACNHWHAPAAIWACQANKHVYVEKPVSHNVWEGRKLVEAARKYKRCVQGGTQRRSNGRARRIVQLIHDGLIGEIYLARAVLAGARDTIGYQQVEVPPSWLHWDLWLGPAPIQPFHRNLVHYNWHWFWDFGNGEMGNNGSHSLDYARWAIRKGLPRHVHAVGGRYGYRDQAETPNTLTTTFEYDDGTTLVSEIRGLYTVEQPAWQWHFYGTKGYVYFDATGATRIRLGRNKQDEPDPGRMDDIGHYDNFISAIRAGQPELLTAEIEQLHLTCALCHLGNISYRLKRNLKFDPAKERFIGDTEADALLRRSYRKPYLVSERV